MKNKHLFQINQKKLKLPTIIPILNLTKLTQFPPLRNDAWMFSSSSSSEEEGPDSGCVTLNGKRSLPTHTSLIKN